MVTSTIHLGHLPKRPTINDLRKITPWANEKYSEANASRTLEILALTFCVAGMPTIPLTAVGMILVNESMLGYVDCLFCHTPGFMFYGLGAIAYGLSLWVRQKKRYPRLKASEIKAIASKYHNPAPTLNNSSLSTQLQEVENQRLILHPTTLATLAQSNAYARAKVAKADRFLYGSAALLGSVALIPTVLMVFALIANSYVHLSPSALLQRVGMHSSLSVLLPLITGLYFLRTYLAKKTEHRTRYLTGPELERFYQKQRNWILYNANLQDQKVVLDSIERQCIHRVHFAKNLP